MMRKSIILLFLLSACFGSLVAEEAYRPMLKMGKVWNCYYANAIHEYNIVFSIDGDTIIDGDRCFKMSHKMIDQHTGATVGEGDNNLFLEKDKKVYLREVTRDSWNWRLLCDFNLQAGDKKPGTNQQVTAIDNIYVQGASYRRFHLSEPGEFGGEVEEGYWVEGVGSSRGLLDTSSWAVTGGKQKLITCYEDGKCIFTSENFENMPSEKTNAVRRKLVRKDKEWWYHDAEAEMYPQEPNEFFMYADGDTLINGVSWKKIYQKRATPIYEKAMREEGGRVYELRPGGQERLLFDFSLNVGDVYEPADEPSRMMTVIAIDTVMVDNNQARRRLLLMQQVNGVTSDLTTWTEGIGSECGIDLPAYWSDMDWRVVELTHGTYYNLQFLGCKDFGTYPEDTIGQMLVDGKQWVYSHHVDKWSEEAVTKVTYTLSGDTLINGRRYAKLYRQEEEDAPVYDRALRESGKTVYCYMKWYDYDIPKEEDRPLIEFNPLFFTPSLVNPYIANLIDRVDEVTVNGRTFTRHRYYEKETDDWWQAFYTGVEGIGFERNGILGMNFKMTSANYLSFEACYEDDECLFTAADFQKPSSDTEGVEAPPRPSPSALHPGRCFDLQGRCVTGQPRPGIYIVDGKKRVLQ